MACSLVRGTDLLPFRLVFSRDQVRQLVARAINVRPLSFFYLLLPLAPMVLVRPRRIVVST